MSRYRVEVRPAALVRRAMAAVGQVDPDQELGNGYGRAGYLLVISNEIFE